LRASRGVTRRSWCRTAGGIRFYRGFGLAERASRTPADTTTRYRVASITKLFTSVLVLQLAQEGKVRLDAPIRGYLPDYPGAGADRVTIHHVLNHTSGIENFTGVLANSRQSRRGSSSTRSRTRPTRWCASPSTAAAREVVRRLDGGEQTAV
jgi:CubicO group peptidase (beta-lactamase class C family)